MQINNSSPLIYFLRMEKKWSTFEIQGQQMFLEKAKSFLKLTSGKTLALNEVLHVPNIRANLVSVAL